VRTFGGGEAKRYVRDNYEAMDSLLIFELVGAAGARKSGGRVGITTLEVLVMRCEKPQK
jgi:hypothetical protein